MRARSTSRPCAARPTRSCCSKCSGSPKKPRACCRPWRSAGSQGARPKRISLRYQGREVTVGEGRKSATLGRAEDNDVVVKGNLISRVHARIEASRDKFTLVDESTNGTFVQTNAGEEIFVRRDSTQLTGEGVIGLGRVAQPGTALAVHYVVEE